MQTRELTTLSERGQGCILTRYLETGGSALWAHVVRQRQHPCDLPITAIPTMWREHERESRQSRRFALVWRALYLNSAAGNKRPPPVRLTLWAQARIRPKSRRESGAGLM